MYVVFYQSTVPKVLVSLCLKWATLVWSWNNPPPGIVRTSTICSDPGPENMSPEAGRHLRSPKIQCSPFLQWKGLPAKDKTLVSSWTSCLSPPALFWRNQDNINTVLIGQISETLLSWQIMDCGISWCVWKRGFDDSSTKMADTGERENERDELGGKNRDF